MKDLDTMERELDLSMSNLDHTIDKGLAEKLKENEGKLSAQYSGWNFCGYVWYENRKYTCQVWQYHSPREEISEGTLEELMESVSQEWGQD